MTTTPPTTTNNTTRRHDHLLLYEFQRHLDFERRRRRRRRRSCYYKTGSATSSLTLLLLTIVIFTIDAVDAFEISSGRINRYHINSINSKRSPPRRCRLLTTSSTSRIQKYTTGDATTVTTSSTTACNDLGWNKANTVLSAVMYGTDGKKISDDLSSGNDDDDDKNTLNEPSFIPDRRFDTKLVEKLNTKTSVSGLLKVVACAFAEPPHDTILPKNVVVATLVEISQSRMDIALGVKTFDESRGGGSPSSDGQQSLVQLLIKVPLTTPCPSNKSSNKDNDDDEIDNDVAAECVAKTLNQLEPYSVARIEKRERRQTQKHDTDDFDEEDDDEEEEWPPKVVTDIIETSSTKESPSVAVSTVENFYGDTKPDSNYRYPDWWTFPSPLEKTLSDECDSMKTLLNEDDFANDRVQLSKQGQKDTTNKEVTGDVLIQKAFVAIIGPAGLVMRTQQSVNDEGMNVVEELVPVRFVRGAIAKSPETLRDLVLELVESLGETERQEESTEEQKELLVQEAEPTLESRVTDSAPVGTVPSSVSKTRDSVELSKDIIEARRQPKSPPEESKLASKYASIENIGDRAFAILKDLRMI